MSKKTKAPKPAPIREPVAPQPDRPDPAVRASLMRPSMLWRPAYLNQSAWIEHVPFAFWLTDVVRPSCMVELGTHYGVSYFAFCQAVARLSVSTRCYAVDTWKGDEHSGLYGEEVFATVAGHNRAHYSGFSTLLRQTFDDALNYFADGSIDLLHIDGLHTYEAVLHDFTSWRPKLSDRAVVLFHDTNVRSRDFGVWRLLDELRQTYPVFEFLHGHGLGVVAVGAQVPTGVADLIATGLRADEMQAARAMFSDLGQACFESLKRTTEARDRKTLAQDLEKERKAVAAAEQAVAEARRVTEEAKRQLSAEKAEASKGAAEGQALRASLAEAEARLAKALASEDAQRKALEAATADLAAQKASGAGLAARLGEAEARAGDIKSKLLAERSRSESVGKELAALREALAQRDADHAAVSLEHATLADRLLMLEREAEAHREERAALEAAIAQLELDARNQAHALDTATQDRADLANRLNAESARAAELKSKLLSARAALSNAQSEATTTHAALAALRDETARLAGALSDGEATIDRLRKTIATRDVGLADLKRHADGLEKARLTEQKVQTARIADLAQHVDRLTASLNAAETGLATTSAALMAEIEAERSRADAAVSTLEHERSEAGVRIERLMVDLAESESLRKRVGARLTEANQTLDQLEARRLAEAAAAEAERAALSSELSNARHELHQAVSALKQRTLQADEQAASLDTLTATLRAAELAGAGKDVELGQLRETASQLRSALDGEQEARGRLEADIAQRHREISILSRLMMEAERRSDESQAQASRMLADANAEVERWRATHASVAQRVGQLETERTVLGVQLQRLKGVEAERAKLATERESLQHDGAKLRDRLNQREAALDQHQARTSLLTDRLVLAETSERAQSAEVERLIGVVGQFQHTIASLRRESARLRTETVARSERDTALAQDAARFSAIEADLRARIAALELDLERERARAAEAAIAPGPEVYDAAAASALPDSALIEASASAVDVTEVTPAPLDLPDRRTPAATPLGLVPRLRRLVRGWMGG